MSERKKQFRFSEKDDLVLMSEIISKNPFGNRTKWTEVACVMPENCDVRRARERATLLMNQHRAYNSSSQRKSGVDESYTEKEQLLDDMLELSEEQERLRKKEKDKTESEEKTGQDIRKGAMESLSKSDEESVSTKRPRKNNNEGIVDYLKEKNESERILRKQELDIRKEEIKLQRERFELEKEERRQQTAMMGELMKALINKTNM